MSDDTIGRGLLRRLDWAQPPHRPLERAPQPASDTHEPLPQRIDVTTVLEAVHLLATSMSTMAERIQELEAHADAFAASNEELEVNNLQLTLELGGIIQERESLAASLATQDERLRQLERYAALGIARATALNHDMSTAHADLARIVDAVGSRLLADASLSFETP